MRKLDACLKANDVTVWLKLQQQDIKPQYYAFRWLTLLLSQEFELPGTDSQLFMTALHSKGKKVKFSHTRYQELGPELIPVYRQSAHR